MSSTQHQLIEQCATRLRGIVEALDNIHDTSPHRWSTDLDDVHSSAESLLAMINDQASNQADLAQPSPVRSSLLINGYQLRAALEFIAPDGTAKQLESEARIEWRQQDADFLEAGLYAWCAEYPEEGCVLLDEEPATAQPSPAQAEQAEAERPPQPERYTADVFHPERPYYMAQTSVVRASDFDEFATQYERIVGALRAKLQAAEGRADTLEHRMMGMMTRHFAEAWRNRDTQKALDGYLSAGIAQLEQERDAALAEVERLTRDRDDCLKARMHYATEYGLSLARVAELTATRNRYGVDAHYFNMNLQRILRDFESFTPDELARSLIILAKVADEKVVAQAQHSAPEGYALIPVRETEAMHDAVMALLYKGVARTDTQKLLDAYIVAAPGKEVPQAWLDVQAERLRQVEAEGWTPEHDDQHGAGELADAAACYALWAGGINPGNWREFWPWAPEWLKHSEPRRMLVKACALALAEIERLDRATTGGDA
ncbi:TPA: hypothetical protein ACXJOU_000669 [Pseudomonas aeruginosa]